MLSEIREKLEKGQSYKIVFLGDSLTDGYYVHPNFRSIVEYVLKDKLSDFIEDWRIPSWKVRCINSGLDGSTTRDLADRLGTLAFDYKPDLVICAAGGNDMMLGFSIDEHVESAGKLIHSLSEKVKTFYFDLSPHLDREKREEFRLYTDAFKRSLPGTLGRTVDAFSRFHKIVDFKRIFSLVNSYGNSDLDIRPGAIDTAHPDALGNAYVAKVVLKEVFGVDFDPEKYISDIQNSQMFPAY